MAVEECLRLKVLRGELERSAYAAIRRLALEARAAGAERASAWEEAALAFAAEAAPELRARVLEIRREGKEAARDKELCAVASEAALAAEKARRSREAAKARAARTAGRPPRERRKKARTA